MLNVALVEPEIHPNTGNIARLCAATNTPLNIIGATGFRLDDRAVRRAGLDYWPEVKISRYPRLESLYHSLPEFRFLYFSTKGSRCYLECDFTINDCLIFGPETRGLPEETLRANWDRVLTIPMLNPKVRSLNLATAVAIALYEALHRIGAFAQDERRKK
jgi:tRNA (cytidine/uridine-2'-O-)-methyltransferase